jgi:hypothetical protein
MRVSVLEVLFRNDDLRDSEVEVEVSIDCFTLPFSFSLLLAWNPADCFEVARAPGIVAATGCKIWQSSFLGW